MIIVGGNRLPALVLRSGLASGPPDIPPDLVPDAFSFADVSNGATGSTQTSAPITVSGLTGPAPVSVSGGTYSKNGGAFTSAAGTAVNGDTFALRHTAASSSTTSVATTLTIGGVSNTFTSTTGVVAVATSTWTTAAEYTKTDVGGGWFRVEKTSGITALSPSLHTTAPITGDFTLQMLRGPVFGDQILGVNDTQGATFNTIEAAIYTSYGSLQAISAGAVADGGASYGQPIGVRDLLVLQRVGSTISLYQTTDFNKLGPALKTWTNSAPFYGQLTISQIAADAAVFIRMFEGVVEPRAADTGTPINFEDSGYVSPDNGFLRTSTFARTVYETTATSLTLNTYNTIYAIVAGWAQVGLIVNGAYQSVAIAGNGFQSTTVTLPAGTKTIEIVNGIQSNTNGIFLVSVSGNAPLTRKLQATKPRILFYGDSITAGILTDNPPHDAYPMLVRAALPGYSIALEAFGGRQLNQDCYNAAARTRLVRKIAGQNPVAVYLAIGSNDFGGAVIDAPTFGTQYGAFVDDLHAASPGAIIYCQTLIPTSPSGPNGLGSSAADYRTQVANIVAARPSFCRLVDGTTLVSLSNIPDGVHPNTAGHAQYGAAVLSALGL